MFVLDATTPALDAPGSSRVALCLVGQPRDVINATLQPLRDELLDSLPLPVDLFVVSSLDLPSDLDGEATYVARIEDAPAEDFAALVKASPTNFGSWRTGALSGFGKGSLWGYLAQLNSTSTCWRAVRLHEAQRGFNYTAVGKARLDARWFGRLPRHAWELVARNQTAITPKGSDFGGVNDRFVLAPRRAFDTYAGLYDALLTAAASATAASTRSGRLYSSSKLASPSCDRPISEASSSSCAQNVSSVSQWFERWALGLSWRTNILSRAGRSSHSSLDQPPSSRGSFGERSARRASFCAFESVRPSSVALRTRASDSSTGPRVTERLANRERLCGLCTIEQNCTERFRLHSNPMPGSHNKNQRVWDLAA